MHFLFLRALPCLLAAQAASLPPLSFAELESHLRQSPLQLQTEAALAQQQLELITTAGFLREAPTLSAGAGPRTTPGMPGEIRRDRLLEVDLPLFSSPGAHRDFAQVYGAGAPILREAARVEARFRLRQVYLETWLDAEAVKLRETDLEILRVWRQAARARVEAGADPPFLVSLVDGEWLRAVQERDEALRRALTSWATLRVLADNLPEDPRPLADPGTPDLPAGEGLRTRYWNGTLRRALQLRQALEAGSSRLEEAQSLSRLSLRASTAKEGEETVTRLGFALRLPRPGETQALRQRRLTRMEALNADFRADEASLDARFQAALASLQAAQDPASSPAVNFTAALSAADLRLREGKDRFSEALPLRRQLLEGQLAALRRRQSLHVLAAEVEALTEAGHP